MTIKLAIDFGTTNSVLARWDDAQKGGEIVSIPGLSRGFGAEPGLIPTLLFVRDGRGSDVLAGQAVLTGGLDRLDGSRFFRNFKRSIGADKNDPRILDGAPWTDFDAGRLFLRSLLDGLPYQVDEIEQLVVTVPVASFDGYASWLNQSLGDYAGRVRIVDESTAAALGYAVTEPGAIVLVVDFGGGTLDLSLVRLPDSREKTGHVLFTSVERNGLARVIAKAGLSLGGSDIDRWLFEYVLDQAGLAQESLGEHAVTLLLACEQVKMVLSSQEQAEIEFQTADSQRGSIVITRDLLELLMEQHGFFASLNGALEKVMGLAHQKDVYREDIRHVLLVGGTSLVPSVQRTLDAYFRAVMGERRRPTAMPAWPALTWSVENTSIRADKPFTAVVEGALLVSAGFGLDDQLAHGYGLRYLDADGNIACDEIIPMGSLYPSIRPVKVNLAVSHSKQDKLTLSLRQINAGATASLEVRYEKGQPVFFAHASADSAAAAFRDAGMLTVVLDPPGEPGKTRLSASFSVDAQRRLHVTVTDLKTRKKIARDVVLEQSLNQQPGVEISDSDLPVLAGKSESGFRLSLAGLGATLNLLNPSQASPDVLAAALRSPDCMIRYTAAELLSQHGDRESRLVFENIFKDGTPYQRASAIRHAYRFSWFAAEPLFLRALSDPDPRVGEAAVFALCKMRQPEAYRLVMDVLRHGSDAMRISAIWGLQNHPDAGAVPVLALALQADSPEIRALALEVLGASDAPVALPFVRAAMDDPDDNVKYAAALSLVELAREACFDEFAVFIENSSGQSRRSVLRGLFHATNYLGLEIGRGTTGERLFSALENALNDGLSAVRVSASMLLAWSHDPCAGEMLIRAYRNEPDSETRAHILTNAVNLFSPVAGALLREALAGDDKLARQTAEFLRDRLRSLT